MSLGFLGEMNLARSHAIGFFIYLICCSVLFIFLSGGNCFAKVIFGFRCSCRMKRVPLSNWSLKELMLGLRVILLCAIPHPLCCVPFLLRLPLPLVSKKPQSQSYKK